MQQQTWCRLYEGESGLNGLLALLTVRVCFRCETSQKLPRPLRFSKRHASRSYVAGVNLCELKRPIQTIHAKVRHHANPPWLGGLRLCFSILFFMVWESRGGVHGPMAHSSIWRWGYKVQTRATQPLLDRGMNFGVRFAFDSGRCFKPWKVWKIFCCGNQKRGGWGFMNYVNITNPDSFSEFALAFFIFWIVGPHHQFFFLVWRLFYFIWTGRD